MRRLLLLLLVPGCIAAHGRAHMGPSVDSEGKVGIYGGLMFGAGYAGSPDSGVALSAGAATGEESRLLISGAVDYARLPESDDDFGYRAGIGAHMPAIGERGLAGAHAALLYPLRRRESSGGHEKSFHTTSHSAWLVGVEAFAGAAYNVIRGADPHTDVGLGARLALTFEWLAFSTVR